MRSYARLWGEQLHAAGGQMLEQVRTGIPAFQLQFGQPIWQRYGAHPEEASTFDEFMSVATGSHLDAILGAWDFGRHTRVVDVGAQRGRLLAAVLARHPTLRGVWFDREEERRAAKEYLAGEGLTRRCDLVPGSFLESVPSGGDLYVLKHVLHDWRDEEARTILRNVAGAMAPGASLLVIEGVLDLGDPSSAPCLLRDLEQMAWTGGRLRTRGEHEELLRSAELQIGGVRRTPIPDLSLLHARSRVVV